jgi:hypothetical protein
VENFSKIFLSPEKLNCYSERLKLMYIKVNIKYINNVFLKF